MAGGHSVFRLVAEILALLKLDQEGGYSPYGGEKRVPVNSVPSLRRYERCTQLISGCSR